jgi:hypothetical protein
MCLLEGICLRVSKLAARGVSCSINSHAAVRGILHSDMSIGVFWRYQQINISSAMQHLIGVLLSLFGAACTKSYLVSLVAVIFDVLQGHVCVCAAWAACVLCWSCSIIYSALALPHQEFRPSFSHPPCQAPAATAGCCFLGSGQHLGMCCSEEAFAAVMLDNCEQACTALLSSTVLSNSCPLLRS